MNKKQKLIIINMGALRSNETENEILQQTKINK